MNKKHTLSLLAVISSLITFAQEQKHRLSLVSDLDAEIVTEETRPITLGIQYQYSLTERQNLSAFFAVSNKISYFGADYVYDFPLVGNKLEFNLGGGMGLYKYNTPPSIGIDYDPKEWYLAGTVGFTYNFSAQPLSIFAA
ncbi:MAG: hypothetical protein ACI35V_07400 [Sphingobacterium composti]